MPRWVPVLIVTPLALCIGCGSLGYFVLWPKLTNQIQSALAEEMANAVAASVSDKIERTPLPSNRFVLTRADIDVNNAVFEASDQCGFNVTNNRATIYGVETELSPAGVSIVCLVTYSAVPVITDGRVDLTQVTVSEGTARFVFPKERFEEGMEAGINRALATAGLTPTALTLDTGLLPIATTRTV